MSIFSPADIAEFRTMQDDMAFSDWCRLERQHEVRTDSRGNRVFRWVVIGESTCRLRSRDLMAGERVIVDKIGWTNAVAVDMPWETMAEPEHRIVIDDRTFHVGVVNRESGLGMNPVALCEERSH